MGRDAGIVAVARTQRPAINVTIKTIAGDSHIADERLASPNAPTCHCVHFNRSWNQHLKESPDELTEADVDDVFNINVRGLLMLTVGLGDSMIERGGGSIVNVSSVAGLIGPLGRVAYSGTKGAVDAMTRALAADWGRHGIRVNSVAPGIIATDIWEESRQTVPGLIEKMEAGVSLRRWGQSRDVADVVLFLASDLSSYVTGETIAIDGGMAKVRGGGEPEYKQ